MAFELSPDVHVRRDSQGHVRQLSHPASPYRPQLLEEGAERGETLTPRALSDQYLRDVRGILDVQPEDLQFMEERSITGSVTVFYSQTLFGLPIWDAAIAVRISTGPMYVTGSDNGAHYHVDVVRPPADSPYGPHRVDVATLRKLLNLTPSQQPAVESTRLLIYCYVPGEVIEPHVSVADTNGSRFPTLPIPQVPVMITPNRYYVVTEALFSLATDEWGTLHWRAFVEPVSGAVLYLRTL